MIEVERRDGNGTGRVAMPIVAVCGRWGKTTVARLLEAMLPPVHPRLALWIDQGVYVNGRRQLGELIPWGEALRALAGGELDLAIQELDAGTVNAVGLPHAAYALGIITSFCGNDEACLADPRAAVERQAQLAVARAIHPTGALVLNADDHAVAGEGAASPGEPIYYAVSRRNPIVKAHLAAEGKAVSISSGMIVLCEGRRSRPVLPVRDVAISLGGAIVFQVQNALAAVAAAWRLGVPVARMASALRAFTSAPTLMPGACNQLRVGGATVIVDRLQDTLGTRALVRGLRRVRGAHRRLVLLPVGADLDPPAMTEIGRLLGRSFDLVIAHTLPDPPADTTIRESAAASLPGSAAVEALRAGLAFNPVPPMLLALPGEGPALDRLLHLLRPDDLALVLAADLSFTLRTLLTHRPPGGPAGGSEGRLLPTGTGGPRAT